MEEQNQEIDKLEDYVKFVTEQIEKLNQYTTIIKNNDFSFYDINKAQADNLQVLLALNSEYRRYKYMHKSAQNSFDVWYSEKYMAERFEHNKTELAASKYLSKDELKAMTITNNKEEYTRRINHLTELETKIELLRSLREDWKSSQFSLKSLSENLRSEWFGSMSEGKEVLPQRRPK